MLELLKGDLVQTLEQTASKDYLEDCLAARYNFEIEM